MPGAAVARNPDEELAAPSLGAGPPSPSDGAAASRGGAKPEDELASPTVWASPSPRGDEAAHDGMVSAEACEEASSRGEEEKSEIPVLGEIMAP